MLYNSGMASEGYDTAQICLNGHVITGSFKAIPQFASKFCAKCGAESITACKECGSDIPGYYRGGRITSSAIAAPAFCKHCGAAHPWTRAALEQANELTDLIDGLNETERQTLKASFPDLISDTPKTQVAALRTGKLLKNVESNFKIAFRDILIGIATESAKSILKSAGMPF